MPQTPPLSSARLVILGQGAIGSLLAARCQSQDLDYAVLPRQGNVKAVSFTAYEGSTIHFCPPQTAMETLQSEDILVLALKAYHILPALKALRPYLSEQALVLLHNGMGTLAPVQSLCPRQPLLVGITRMAALKSGQQVTETGAGATDMGWITPSADAQRFERIQTQLSAMLAPCTWHQDMQPALWMKLAVNAVINPLTALYRVPNGALAEPRFAGMIRTLCTEIATVMQALGVAGADMVEKRVREVIAATAANFSSMHQDVLYQRQTEIDYINGHVVNTAESLKLDVPLNRQLWQRIRALPVLRGDIP